MTSQVCDSSSAHKNNARIDVHSRTSSRQAGILKATRVRNHDVVPFRITWTPHSFRKVRLAALILALLLSIVGLELVYRKITSMDGVPSKNRNVVRALQYVPTVIAILLGFAWKSMSSDFSLIMPWAAMSGRWVKASDSILLNYIDSLDVISVYTAIRHRHWALALVVACGLLSGATVPLANALSQEFLSTGHNTTETVFTKDKFVFNGSLAMPIGWRSVQPALDVASYAGERTEKNHYPYLTTWHAYPSFNTDGLEDTLIDVQVNSFSAKLSCEPIEYSGRYLQAGRNSSFVLEAQNNADCDLPISQTVIWPKNSSNIDSFSKNNQTDLFNVPPFTWSNITSCNAEDDFRWLMTSMAVEIPVNQTSITAANGTLRNNTGGWRNGSINVLTTGLICSPTYWSTPANITFNSTTGLIGSVPVLDQEAAEKISDVGVGLDVIHALLNYPTDPLSQIVFEAAATNDLSDTIPNSYDWSQFSDLQVMQKYGFLYLYNYALNGVALNGDDVSPMDPFSITFFSDQTAWKFFENITLMKETTENGFSQMLATQVSTAARAPDRTPIVGTLYRPSDLFYIRINILRPLQAVLGFLALVALVILCLATPYTLLNQDPASLDQVSRIIANSPDVHPLFANLGSLGNDMLHWQLKDTYCRLTRDNNDRLRLEFSKASHGGHDLPNLPIESHEMSDLGDSENAQQSTAGVAVEDILGDATSVRGHRFRPLALRIGSRIGILSVLGAVAIVAVLLLSWSRSKDGFQIDSSTETTAYDLVPTAILVIIGYSISSIEHAALTLSTYSQLVTNSARSGRAMVRRQVRDVSKVLFERQAAEWSFVSVSCLSLVIAFPVLKIMAGNMYYPSFGSVRTPATFSVNVSPIRLVNNLSQWVDISAAPLLLAPVSKDLSQRYAQTREIYVTFDRLGSLNFPVMDYNISSLLESGPQSTEHDKLEVQMESLNTSVTCSAAHDGDFALFATSCNETSGYEFQFQCISKTCESQYNLPMGAINVSTTILPSNRSAAQEIPYFGTTYPSKFDDSMTVILANFSGLSSSAVDFAKVTCDGKPIDRATLGENMPSIRAINCTRDINLVNANVTFSRLKAGSDVHANRSHDAGGREAIQRKFTVTLTVVVYSSTQTDWQPTAYDPTSVVFINETIASDTYPAPVLLPDGGQGVYHTGKELHPRLSALYFLSLLCQKQEIRSGNHLDLFEIETLKSTTAEVYQDYSQLALSLALGAIDLNDLTSRVPSNALPAPELRNVTNGLFTLYRPVVRQDFGFTISLVVLVVLVFCCVAFLSLLIPRSTLLPKAPGSIAAQMSMLAGSNLVSLLKAEMDRDAPSNGLFKQNKFGLGWWPVNDQNDDAGISTGIRGMRWGIDIGELVDDNRGLQARRRNLAGTVNRHLPSMLSSPLKARINAALGSSTTYASLPVVETDEGLSRYWEDTMGRK
ncbi:hypothetical protein LTR70_007837 [Exophiala xenobiotica]|nr:hypothetical protein LTR70_007837 [Exophiala xenobiotica]